MAVVSHTIYRRDGGIQEAGFGAYYKRKEIMRNKRISRMYKTDIGSVVTYAMDTMCLATGETKDLRYVKS